MRRIAIVLVLAGALEALGRRVRKRDRATRWASGLVCGVMSPKPTVVIAVSTKYLPGPVRPRAHASGMTASAETVYSGLKVTRRGPRGRRSPLSCKVPNGYPKEPDC